MENELIKIGALLSAVQAVSNLLPVMAALVNTPIALLPFFILPLLSCFFQLLLSYFAFHGSKVATTGLIIILLLDAISIIANIRFSPFILFVSLPKHYLPPLLLDFVAVTFLVLGLKAK